MVDKMCNFAVLGNPIKHSKSPLIYSIFASLTNIKSSKYIKILVSEDNFSMIINKFFANGGLGINITAPFKEYAIKLCNNTSYISNVTKVVNTIKKQKDGTLFGDNTDGIGLINDLIRLRLLEYNSNILLIGAGGVAKIIVMFLLSYGCKIFITNRSINRAINLYNFYKQLDQTCNIILLPIQYTNKYNYDLIINATPVVLDLNKIRLSTITRKTAKFYDLYYHSNYESVLLKRRKEKINYYDGIGMLIYQAAYSFFLWHGIYPPVSLVLKYFIK
ncbi:MAG: shikimate dehydrogenase [Candidatus Lightella neohaematopini]|nr:shikimate dehydrogenase [Candidatus Lightella neohaematopini]